MPFKLLWWCQTRHKSLSLSGSLMLQYINPPHTYIIHYIKLYIYYTLYYYHPRIGSMKHTDTSVNVESIHGHPMTFRFQLLSDLGHSREEALGPRSKIVIQIWLVVSWFICYVLKHVGKKPEVALFFFAFSRSLAYHCRLPWKHAPNPKMQNMSRTEFGWALVLSGFGTSVLNCFCVSCWDFCLISWWSR